MAAPVHGSPAPEADCQICCELLLSSNYVEFQIKAGSEWYPSPYCSDCLQEYFLNRPFAKYLELLKEKYSFDPVAMEYALNHEPALFVRDIAAFTGPDRSANPTGQAHAFWFQSDDTIVSARIKDAPAEDSEELKRCKQEMFDEFSRRIAKIMQQF